MSTPSPVKEKFIAYRAAVLTEAAAREAHAAAGATPGPDLYKAITDAMGAKQIARMQLDEAILAATPLRTPEP